MLLAAVMIWPQPAQAMTVAQFLEKADSVKARGVLALMSTDAGLLKSEMQQVMTAYRADVAAARKAGKPPPAARLRQDNPTCRAMM